MKAPEKIYLRKRNKLPLEVVRDEWHEKDPQYMYGSVEYIRTDAFINKAREWFEQQPEIYDANGVRVYGEEDFEGFVNYMKGE